MSSVGRQNTIGKCDSVSTLQKNTVLTQLCIDLGNVKSLLGENTAGRSQRTSDKSNTEHYKGKRKIWREKNSYLNAGQAAATSKGHRSQQIYRGQGLKKKQKLVLLKKEPFDQHWQGKGKFRWNTQKLSLFGNQVFSPKEVLEQFQMSLDNTLQGCRWSRCSWSPGVGWSL